MTAYLDEILHNDHVGTVDHGSDGHVAAGTEPGQHRAGTPIEDEYAPVVAAGDHGLPVGAERDADREPGVTARRFPAPPPRVGVDKLDPARTAPATAFSHMPIWQDLESGLA
jgi:hypothetical protein